MREEEHHRKRLRNSFGHARVYRPIAKAPSVGSIFSLAVL